MSKTLLLLFLHLLFETAKAQFAPAAGQAGTEAMHTDSSSFVAWANNCTISRGPVNLSNLSQGLASFGDSSSATGKADGINVVSLGDGGEAILTFGATLYDGPGYDFAVFENSFSDDYLEFAFVEVSSDGQNYFRFPSISNTQDSIQLGPFDLCDPTKIHNLAGKYRALYGTPFDLNELSGQTGLDIQNISHIKLIDVVGSILPIYSTVDSQGKNINDPWPSPFPSCGFDLDAVGIIHQNNFSTNGITNFFSETNFFPNPFQSKFSIKSISKVIELKIRNFSGECVKQVEPNGEYIIELQLNDLKAGVYFLEIKKENTIQNFKIVKNE